MTRHSQKQPDHPPRFCMLSSSIGPPGRSPMPSIPLPNQPYPDPTPADPDPAPSHPPLPAETPGLEPVGVPSPAPSNIPLPNEPAGIPPTMPPEIPSSPTMPQPQA